MRGHGPRGPASHPHGRSQELRHLELRGRLAGRLHSRRAAAPATHPRPARHGPPAPLARPRLLRLGRCGCSRLHQLRRPAGACAEPSPPLPRCAGRLRVWQWRAVMARWARHRGGGGPLRSTGCLLSAASSHRGPGGVLRRGIPFFPRQAWRGWQPCREDGCWRREGARPFPVTLTAGRRGFPQLWGSRVERRWGLPERKEQGAGLGFPGAKRSGLFPGEWG